MTKIILMIVVSLVMMCSSALALDVTSIVFSISTTEVTSTANLRITVQKRDLKNDKNSVPIQGFALQPDSTYNYFLTKTTTFPVTNDFIAVQVEVDQNTNMKVNSESAYKLIRSGETRTYVLK